MRKNGADQHSTPPHSEEAEKGVLGCIMLSPADCLRDCLCKLPDGERTFYTTGHRHIYSAMMDLHERMEPVDIITLQARLNDRGLLDQAGGFEYLAALPDSTPTSANLDYYIQVLLEKADLRNLVRECQTVIDRASGRDEPLADIMADLAPRLQALFDPRLCRSGGSPLRFDDLCGFRIDRDDNTVLGVTEDGTTTRYLCRGGSAWLIGPSGVGKSSLALQMAVGWAAGIPVFGIRPVRPLRVTFVQAENDEGDLAEMAQGVAHGMGLDAFGEDAVFSSVNANVVCRTEVSTVGARFCSYLRRVVTEDRADLVFVDPLLSFAGIDVSKQDQCSQFLRSWLNPVLKETGVVLVGIHHTGKPNGEQRRNGSWSDAVYAGLGSSELANWARAVQVLRPVDDTTFELRLAKRGRRAGACHPSGEPTTSIWLRHCSDRIFWEHIGPPEEPAGEDAGPKKKRGAPSKIEEVAGMNLHSFLSGCSAEGEGLNGIAKRLEDWLAAKNQDLHLATCKRVIPLLVERQKLRKEEGKYYVGENA